MSSKDNQIKNNKKNNQVMKKEKDRVCKASEKSDSDSDYTSCSDEEEDELNVHEYRKYLTKMFPSKHLNEKIKSGEKLKKMLKKESDEVGDDDEEWEEEINKKSSKKKGAKIPDKNNKKSDVKSSKKVVESDSSTDESEFESESNHFKKDVGKFNINFTINYNSDDEEDEDYDEGEDDDEDEYSESSSEDEDEDIEDTEDEDSKLLRRKHNIPEKKIKPTKVIESIKDVLSTTDDNTSLIEKENPEEEMLKQLLLFQSKNKDNKSISDCIKICETNIKEQTAKQTKRTKKQKEKNVRIFKKSIRDKESANDTAFFNKLDVEAQKVIIKEMRAINKLNQIEKPYRITLLETDIPPSFKALAMKKINNLRYIEPGTGEHYKMKNWVDTFMRIPFGKYKNLPLSIDDGVEKCHDFMENAQKTLDSAVYGMNDAKMQIMQLMGQLITNPSAIGSAIAIHGCAGVGKTTIVKEGISKILNRPFCFIALGGATDSSFLEGHSSCYEGSMWGKIVQMLIDCNCMNPVIYFDELDKISDTPKGDEITGILTHLTDTSQNSQFHDKYFSEIDFDLSKCLFIFSYNDESKVNPILRDRMYKIKINGYDLKQKTVISNQYLLPRIRDQVKFLEGDIIIPDESVSHIIENHTYKEEGVRNLKRCLEIIHTKLNLYRLMKPGSNLFEKDMDLKVEFPIVVTKNLVDKLIKKERNDDMAIRGMYI